MFYVGKCISGSNFEFRYASHFQVVSGAGGSLGTLGMGKYFGYQELLLLHYCGQRAPCPRGSELGNDGPSPHGEIGQG